MNQLKRFAVMDNNEVIHIFYPGDKEELYQRYCSGIDSGYGVVEFLNRNTLLVGRTITDGELDLEDDEVDENIVDDDVLQYAFYSLDTGVIFGALVTASSNEISSAYRSAYASESLYLMDITEYSQIISMGDLFVDGVFITPDATQES
jgi:hypothetical protein